VTTVETTEVAERFLDALSRRDFAALAATFAEDGRLRGLVPTALRQVEGRDAIAQRFALWNDGENWQLADSEIEPVADMIRIRWRVETTDPEAGNVIFEQTAYAEVGEHGVTRMNLVCSGERPAG
jgi:ketosteroid isomerase-like protein